MIGALGSWGAALLEPYSDNANTTGIMRSTPKALSSLVRKFWKDGFQVVSPPQLFRHNSARFTDARPRRRRTSTASGTARTRLCWTSSRTF
jgi:hypothetical protein